jgi:hypothetical protein
VASWRGSPIRRLYPARTGVPVQIGARRLSTGRVALNGRRRLATFGGSVGRERDQVGPFRFAAAGLAGRPAVLRFWMRRFLCGVALRNQLRPLRRRQIALRSA